MSNAYEEMKQLLELRAYSPNTQRNYLGHVKHLEQYLDKPSELVSPNEIKQYLQYRMKSGIRLQQHKHLMQCL